MGFFEISCHGGGPEGPPQPLGGLMGVTPPTKNFNKMSEKAKRFKKMLT